MRKKTKRAKSVRRVQPVWHHAHPSYGYIAVGFIFVVLVLLVSGLQ
ncbi:hypothetical protein HYT17_01830 [Candidatus Microgenomates bacterium]|nr:hypothetical protein [Candidatus Microgenomates bacterium]